MNATANPSMVGRLIYKDWYFNRWALAGYLAVGLVAIALLAFGGDGAFYAGCVALITVLISIGIHLTMRTIVEERKDQTLAFLMTLPITPRQFTTAKMLGNLAIFAGAWGILVVGTVAVIAGRPAVPDGMIPFALAVLSEIFAGYCLMLCTAIVSESMGWTIGAMVFGNLLVQAVMYWVSHVPGVAQDLKSDAVVWRPQILGLLAVEAASIVVMVALTFYLQSRKRHFL